MVDVELSRAVVTYLGSPGVLNARDPERRVADLLGDRAYDVVVPRIRAMLADLDAVSPPLWNTASLQEMGRNVERWLGENHPELDEAAVDAVANSYTFTYK
ncbi:hypothetical protein [Terrabacter tumescens]|uniref:hypothetical protein n=1 Tax=Terrabacter tumescens TaxID=60443 RepID=UPI0004BEFEBE|nr:hypothetical protein [Terrabacter tumescens]